MFIDTEKYTKNYFLNIGLVYSSTYFYKLGELNSMIWNLKNIKKIIVYTFHMVVGSILIGSAKSVLFLIIDETCQKYKLNI